MTILRTFFFLGLITFVLSGCGKDDVAPTQGQLNARSIAADLGIDMNTEVTTIQLSVFIGNNVSAIANKFTITYNGTIQATGNPAEVLQFNLDQVTDYQVLLTNSKVTGLILYYF